MVDGKHSSMINYLINENSKMKNELQVVKDQVLVDF
jgi:hypothetical protein